MNDWSNRVSISRNRDEMAQAAADYAIGKLIAALEQRESVRLLAATGASQLEFLGYVTAAKKIDWNRIELFHLDEYIGVGISTIQRVSPATFAIALSIRQEFPDITCLTARRTRRRSYARQTRH